MEQTLENNNATVSGMLESDFVFDHEVYGERFYKSYVISERTSGIKDRIPIIVSDRIKTLSSCSKGKYVQIDGEFRSYNMHDQDSKRHLILYLFCNNIKIISSEEKNENIILLNGYICKKPIYRVTPKGREIADILLAVNRKKAKSDYIPCIAWGRNAKFAEQLEVGTYIETKGRIESRIYFKRYNPDKEEGEEREAYEVSLNYLNVIE